MEDPQGILNDVLMRIQVAADYQTYLEDQDYYDTLIASDPESAFAAGWVVTFQMAREFGFMQDFSVIGDEISSTHKTSAGDDFVDAKGGNDKIWGYSGDDTLLGGDGRDILYGGIGDDELDGQNGNDTLYGGGGSDTLRGGAGLDEFYIGPDGVTVFGGEDYDLATFFGEFADYLVVDHGGNHVSITHMESGAENVLHDVEFVRFPPNGSKPPAFSRSASANLSVIFSPCF